LTERPWGRALALLRLRLRLTGGCAIFLRSKSFSISDLRDASRVARFLLVQRTKMGKNITNNYIIYNIPNGRKIYQHFPLQDPPKFIQVWIFV
jgi:hypothetical protein